MKIVLLLLSSAILAILCYAFFRNNVTDFYTFIETVEKPFNEKTFIKGFKEEAKNISIYSKDKNDKKELKKLLKKHDDYTDIFLYNEKELYIATVALSLLCRLQGEDGCRIRLSADCRPLRNALRR